MGSDMIQLARSAGMHSGRFCGTPSFAPPLSRQVFPPITSRARATTDRQCSAL